MEEKRAYVQWFDEKSYQYAHAATRKLHYPYIEHKLGSVEEITRIFFWAKVDTIEEVPAHYNIFIHHFPLT